MKRYFIFLWLNLYPAIVLLAQRDYGKYGRDYTVRESSSGSILGNIIIILLLLFLVLIVISGFTGKKNANKDGTPKRPYTNNPNDLNKIKMQNEIEKKMKRWEVSNLVNRFAISPTSKLAKEISDLYYDIGEHDLYYEWIKKAEKLKKEEEELQKQEEEERKKRNIILLEKEFERNPSYSLADKLSKKYQEQKDEKESIVWRIKALECNLIANPNISREEAGELYGYYYKQRNYDKLQWFFKMYKGQYVQNFNERDIHISYMIPYDRNWRSRDLWTDETRARETFNFLYALITSNIYLYDRVRIMNRIAVCYALGYGTEKDLAKAIHWANLIEEYELKNIPRFPSLPLGVGWIPISE